MLINLLNILSLLDYPRSTHWTRILDKTREQISSRPKCRNFLKKDICADFYIIGLRNVCKLMNLFLLLDNNFKIVHFTVVNGNSECTQTFDRKSVARYYKILLRFSVGGDPLNILKRKCSILAWWAQNLCDTDNELA